jgi:hypothetical protein
MDTNNALIILEYAVGGKLDGMDALSWRVISLWLTPSASFFVFLVLFVAIPSAELRLRLVSR